MSVWQEIFSVENKELIASNWEKVNGSGKIFDVAWKKSAMTPEIRSAFGQNTVEDMAKADTYINGYKLFESFFHKLVFDNEFDLSKCEDACNRLGRRHVDIKIFKYPYWDIVEKYFNESVPEVINSIGELKDKDALIRSWIGLMASVLFLMRRGYNARLKEESA